MSSNTLRRDFLQALSPKRGKSLRAQSYRTACNCIIERSLILDNKRLQAIHDFSKVGNGHEKKRTNAQMNFLTQFFQINVSIRQGISGFTMVTLITWSSHDMLIYYHI